MPNQEITIFDEDALRALVADHQKLKQMVVDLQRQVEERNRQDRSILQPIIGKATGEAGSVDGTRAVILQNATRHDGEYDTLQVDAKSWVGAATPAAEANVLIWRSPFGLWHFLADSMLIGKLDAELTAGGSATMSIWTGAGGSESDSTENVTVYDWLLGSGQTVASGKKVVVAYINGVPYVIAAEC
jgi:hypothetical protein